MSVEATSALSFGVGAVVSVALTPVAIRVARRTNFLDRPREYRQHARATPFLGGAAVLIAFLVAGLAVAGASGKLLVPLACAVGLWALGTVDDRIAVAPKWRLLAETGAGVALFVAGLGWDTSLGGAADLVLTIASVLIAVNAFNLMDNLDGACSSVTAVAAAGIGVLAAIRGQTAIAGLALALSGACAGFLPWNLAGPAKVFLGDGGSMPLGFLTAALAIVVAHRNPNGNAGILVGAMLVGLPIFDMTLVSFSRTRRGVPLVTGGRDHLTHRLLLVLRSPRVVAVALAVLQGLLSTLGILAVQVAAITPAGAGLSVFLVSIVAILVLDTAGWRPAGIAIALPEAPVVPTPPAPGVEEV
jgi:UDP-GlcNAc:undecaprenyl-phosphate GlcNAc-1-phosphate transferase